MQLNWVKAIVLSIIKKLINPQNPLLLNHSRQLCYNTFKGVMFLKVLCKGFFLITILFLLLAPVQPVFAGDIDILVVVPATGQKFYT